MSDVRTKPSDRTSTTAIARRMLDQYHFSILKDMVGLLMVPVNTTRKQDYVRALAEVLFTPAAVEKGLSLLSERERKALTLLQNVEDRLETGRLQSLLLRQGLVEPESKKKYRYHVPYSSIIFTRADQRTSFGAVLGRLMAVGLVCGTGIVTLDYSNRTKVYYDNVQSLYIPDPVRSLLPEPPPLQPEVYRVEDLTHVDESSARAFQRDLYFYWSTARANPLTLTKQGRLYKRDLHLVNEALLHPQDLGEKGEPDHPRLIFLRLLLTGLGMLEQDDSQIRAVRDPRFFAQRPASRIRQTFECWRDGSFWNEALSISHVTIAGAGSRVDPAPAGIARARARVLDHIAKLQQKRAQPEQWTLVQHLVGEVRLTDYDFVFPRNYRPRTSHYYQAYERYTPRFTPYISYGNEMGWSFSPPFQDEEEGWESVEAWFIRAILLEPLYWMGLADIGYAEGNALAYRLTPVGAWVLGVGPEVDIPDTEGRVVVQPNFELFALDPISDLTLSRLDEFAERTRAERAIKYEITRTSVFRAQRHGWTADSIIDALRKMSDTPLPQNVVRTLHEWQELHERITIRRGAALLQAVDGDLLDRLVEDSSIRPHLATRPGETVAVISSRLGETEELVLALQAMGYPPARTRSPRDTARPSFTIDKAGQLHFSIALPSIYLYEQLALFTGQDEQGRYWLTQSAIQRALEQGMSVNDILSMLQALHLGPLPRWVEIKVRAWGHYYGSAALETVALVQIRDSETLRELLSEPEIGEILHVFAPDENKVLAVVDTEHLNALSELFAERGITLQDKLD